MRYTLLMPFLFINFFSYAQENTSSVKILTESETQRIFTDSSKKVLGMRFPIFKAYSYFDKSGENHLVLTERITKKEGDKIVNDSIQGFMVKVKKGIMVNTWSFKDYMIKDDKNNEEESAIWFWTKYCELNDVDGLIDPIIVYGTSGLNGSDDGRVKILIYYKGSKIVIRHQNGFLDFQRNTQVDKSFYELPEKIQEYIKGLMKKIEENRKAIFPYGWQQAMKEKKAYFDEK